MAKLAFLGLGQMGVPMAGRLLEAGHDVAVWNRTGAKADPLVERGARRAAAPAEAATGADAVLTMLSTPDALEEVVFGSGGLAEGLSAGQTLIEMSTVGPHAVASIAERLPEHVEVIDAPVLGSVAQARDGTLKVFVGAPAEAFGRWREVLSALGRPIHVGPPGAGASMKLVVNSTLGALMTALGEALALADALRLEQRVVLDVLVESAIGTTTRSKRRNIETGTYDPNFKLELARKDLRIIQDTAARVGVELRVAPAAGRWIDEADDAGLGDRDYSAVVAHIRGR